MAFDPGVDRPAEVDAPGFRELLDLDRPQPGDVFIGPPPRPASLSYSDAVEDRRVWHSLLARHCDARQANPAAGQMLDLLSQLQDLEDAVAARTLAGAKL